ncbi:MAG TPA: PstS family phosphate ABC transporter substrate-binding protein [Longimicrobiales bacterium]|nr:PstS family phosphate ABC transporter substrate-binding protein [Longimicrobiales bacterium]
MDRNIRFPGAAHGASARVLATSILMLAGFIAACGGTGSGDVVVIDGSSTLYPVTEAVAEEFITARGGTVNVLIGISGTGGGFQLFCTGETDISNASRPMTLEEQNLCIEYQISGVELPVAYDGIAVVVNPGNASVACLTVPELRRIWQPGSSVRLWSDVRPEWPAEPINLYGPGADSGTFDYFTEVITGEPGAARYDYMASEDDYMLVQGVASDPNGLGYFGFAYYLENQDALKLVGVDNGRGCVAPSPATILNQTYEPLSRPMFLYVNGRAARRQAVADFVRFYMESAPELVPSVGFVPLGGQQYNVNIRRLESLIGG